MSPASIMGAMGAAAAGIGQIGPKSTIPKKKIKLNYGDSGSHFGHQDYKGNRLAGFSDEDILAYLDANPHTLQGRNVVGNSSGLYERIAGRGTPGTHWGKNQSNFGHADLEGARRQGWSDREIKSYLDQNTGVLKRWNRPGGGHGPTGRQGVYDSLSDRSGWWSDLPAPPPPAPSTQLGTASLGPSHTATGLVSPTAEGANMNTGGSAAAFGRDRKQQEKEMKYKHALAINSLTL